jgi:hypothetical protein
MRRTSAEFESFFIRVEAKVFDAPNGTLTGCFAPIFRPSRVGCHATNRRIFMQIASLIRPTRHAGRRRYRTEHISGCLPFMAQWKNGTSYAPWRVWSGSTTKDVLFVPIPKKVAIRIYHKAVDWNRRGKLAGPLATLKELATINWVRRCKEGKDEEGRFALRHETNAYAILPTSQWRGYLESAVMESSSLSNSPACPCR